MSEEREPRLVSGWFDLIVEFLVGTFNAALAAGSLMVTLVLMGAPPGLVIATSVLLLFAGAMFAYKAVSNCCAPEVTLWIKY